MKPTSPEDREMEKVASEVSERYRETAQDEPAARLDAAVMAAARKEVKPSSRWRAGPLQASVAAAVLVIGISVTLLVRNDEPPLSLDDPAARLAKSVAPNAAMKSQEKARTNAHREDRPSRERSARPDREAKAEARALSEPAASGTTAQSVPASRESPAEGSSSAEVDSLRRSESGAGTAGTPPKALADAATGKKELAAVALQPQEWLRKIEALLQAGKNDEAREQVIGLHRQFPQFSLPPRLQALLPADQR